MADDLYVIDLEGTDTEGHGRRTPFTPDGDDEWLLRKLRDTGSTRIAIRASDDEEDTEGHAAAKPLVRVMVETDDDTEGHAISIHFPSREEADAFRRRLIATGLIVGTVALGAGGGAAVGGALSGQDSGTAGAGAAAAVTSAGGEYSMERGIGISPDLAGAQSGGGEYAMDRGAGVAPAAAPARTGGLEYASDRGAGIAAAAAAAPESGGSEYAADRGAGIAPEGAAQLADESNDAVDTHLGPTPR